MSENNTYMSKMSHMCDLSFQFLHTDGPRSNDSAAGPAHTKPLAGGVAEKSKNTMARLRLAAGARLRALRGPSSPDVTALPVMRSTACTTGRLLSTKCDHHFPACSGSTTAAVALCDRSKEITRGMRVNGGLHQLVVALQSWASMSTPDECGQHHREKNGSLMAESTGCTLCISAHTSS